jgi:hypothetical protein
VTPTPHEQAGGGGKVRSPSGIRRLPRRKTSISCSASLYLCPGVRAAAGLAGFAPAKPAPGAMFSARHRAGRHEEALTVAPVVAEQAYYDPAIPTVKDPNGLESADGALAPDQPVQSEQQR